MALMTRPAERTGLFERDAALTEVRTALGDGARGEGRVVLVSGEAGNGKTTLVRAFIRPLGDEGSVRVLRGACDDLITPRELGPFHELENEARPGLRDALGGGVAPAVLDALLEELATPTTVLVIQDLRWTDNATLDALAFLARPAPAMILGTYRDDEVLPGSPLWRLLGAIRAPVGVRAPLAPLSARAACRSGVSLPMSLIPRVGRLRLTHLARSEGSRVGRSCVAASVGGRRPTT
jgi:hypothetical protein